VADAPAQYDAVCAWGIPNHSLLQRVAAIDLRSSLPVATVTHDPAALLALTRRASPNARLTVYPDSAHGFLFQHHSRFAVDVKTFLTEAG